MTRSLRWTTGTLTVCLALWAGYVAGAAVLGGPGDHHTRHPGAGWVDRTGSPDADGPTSDAGGPTSDVGPPLRAVADKEFHHVPDPDQTAVAPSGTDSGGSAPADAATPDAIDPDSELTDSIEIEQIGNFVRLSTRVAPGAVPLAGLDLDLGDGDVVHATDAQLASLQRGGVLTVLHEYEPTLTPQHQIVVATVRDTAGTTFAFTLRFSTRAYYVLAYSPITVAALNNCDTVGKGDFELTWNHGTTHDLRDDFDLGKGESHTTDRFAITHYGISYDVPVRDKLELREKDPHGAWLLAPWKWDPHFVGQAGPSEDHGPVARFGDHHYDVYLDSDERDGIPGDDDCATTMRFTMYLHMVQDSEEAQRYLDRGLGSAAR